MNCNSNNTDEIGKNWGVIGGGLLGMTSALRLRQKGAKVTLYEATSTLGGLASTWQLGDVHWDKHYHVTLLSDTHLRNLLRELNLESEISWQQTKSGFYAGKGSLVPLSNSLDYLFLPGLNLLDKARLALTIIYAARTKDFRGLEAITATDWLSRLSGRRVVERLWIPLLKAKLGENYRLASAAFIWAIIARLYAARRTGLKREMFGYVNGGYARVNTALNTKLLSLGVTIHRDCRVSTVHQTQNGELRVTRSDGSADYLNRLIVTAPSPNIAELCPDLTPDEKKRLKAIKYQGIICASLLLKNPLAGYYLTYITDPSIPFTAVVEMSSLVDKETFGGSTLVYLPKYLDPTDSDFEKSDQELREEFIEGLGRIFPRFTPSEVQVFQLSRVRQVFAIPTLNYSANVPPFCTSVPGLYIANSSQILNGTLNVNETIALAEAACSYFAGTGEVQ